MVEWVGNRIGVTTPAPPSMPASPPPRPERRAGYADNEDGLRQAIDGA
jgi:hypothetical protein